MKTLWTLEQMVKPVLMAKPDTRDSDKELALEVWRLYYGVSPWTPVEDVLRNDKIPSIESIGRVRRKVQEANVSLRGKRREKTRMEAQKDYIEYAKTDSTSDKI